MHLQNIATSWHRCPGAGGWGVQTGTPASHATQPPAKNGHPPLTAPARNSSERSTTEKSHDSTSAGV